jgi:ATP-dependent DNA helicase RecQ
VLLETPDQIPTTSEAASNSLSSDLERIFGYSQFRPHQEDAIRAAIEGRDCLVVMPTGAGKSLTFQLPAAVSEGVTVVVSPLIALMRDQVIALRERTAFAELGAAYLNSSQSAEEQRDVLMLMRANRLKLLYIAPERLRSNGFVETLQSVNLARVVVDEAHCISEWGHDFRPDYLAISDVLSKLGDVQKLAVTATATVRVQKSIVDNLGMRSPEVIVGGFDRPNLHFSVVKCKNDIERENRLFKALPKLLSRGGSGLVYVSTRKQCESLAELCSQALAPLGMRAGCYHAGMETKLRERMQEAWLNDEIPVLVATNAFGMGIDKPNVRFVIHWGYPESPESYYQEAGRAGRDGRRSRATILTCGVADRKLREFFISNEALVSSDLRDAYNAIKRQAGEEAVRIPRYWWEMEFGWKEPKPRVILGKLERVKAIERLGENQEGALIRLLKKEMSERDWRVVQLTLNREQNERFKRLEEMISYTKCKSCRRRVLLDYFGDEDDPNSSFCCDNCDNGIGNDDQKPTVADVAQGKVAPPSKIETTYDVLQALDALYPSVGKGRLSKVMRGSKSADAQNYVASPVFGAFSGISVLYLSAYLDELINRGLLHQGDEDEYFVVRVTRAGREAWQMQSGADVPLPGRKKSLRLEVSNGSESHVYEESESMTFERLRTWRTSRAKLESVPPYVIFSDKVLREIARQKPENMEEMSGVSGVGATKLEKYGAIVLNILNGNNSSVDSARGDDE